MKKFFSFCMMAMVAAGMSAADLPFTTDPADGATVESIEKVTFILKEGYDFFDIGEEGVHFDKDGEVYCAAIIENDYSSDADVYVYPEEPITEPGTYQLVIDEEMLAVWSMTLGAYGNSKPLVFTYTVEGGAVENNLPFTVDPADGSTVESIEKITFSLKEGYDFFDIGEEGVHFDKDGEVYCAAIIENDYSEHMYIFPEEPITEPGTYQLVIDEEMLAVWSMTLGAYGNGKPLVFTYTVEESAPSVEYTLVPKVTVSEDFTKFTLKFEEGTGMSPAAFATYVNEEAKYSKYALFTDNGDSSFTVEFDEVPPTQGIYIFNVERGMFGDAEYIENNEISGVANDTISMEIDVTVTGIVSVSVNNVNNAVYNLQGVKVSESKENLPAGLYIIDGKKVMIK